MKQPITAASLNFWGSFLEGQNHGQHYKTQPHTLLQACSCPAAQLCWGLGPPGLSIVTTKGGRSTSAQPPIFLMVHKMVQVCCSEVLLVEQSLLLAVEVKQICRAHPVR